jgi:Na+-transporting methylmalonyl-CoA/oxaloacetate decarboxylase gamma subunit
MGLLYIVLGMTCVMLALTIALMCVIHFEIIKSENQEQQYETEHKQNRNEDDYDESSDATSSYDD